MNATILACPPVDREKQLELGILGFAPGPDKTQGLCQKCGDKIWIGDQVRAAKAQNPKARVFCFGCALQGGNATLEHLGGQGGHYLVNPALAKKTR